MVPSTVLFFLDQQSDCNLVFHRKLSDFILELDTDLTDFTDFTLFICVHLYNQCTILEVAITL